MRCCPNSIRCNPREACGNIKNTAGFRERHGTHLCQVGARRSIKRPYRHRCRQCLCTRRKLNPRRMLHQQPVIYTAIPSQLMKPTFTAVLVASWSLAPAAARVARTTSPPRAAAFLVLKPTAAVPCVRGAPHIGFTHVVHMRINLVYIVSVKCSINMRFVVQRVAYRTVNLPYCQSVHAC